VSTPRELDLSDEATARTVHQVVRAAYLVEAELIGSDAIPALHETPERMRALPLRWLGIGAPEAVLGWSPEGDGVDIDRLCVRPDRFRRGLASALLTELLARTEGPVTVATGAANAPAVALYQRHGFTRTGTVEPVPGLAVATFVLRRDLQRG
jgi:ribosomal protein S18 acetylase RimI-like enzyme